MIWPCLWCLVIVICLNFRGLEQFLDLVSGVRQFYLLVCCRSGAIIQPCQGRPVIVISLDFVGIRPCQWSLVIIICLTIASLEHSFDLVSGVWWLFFCLCIAGLEQLFNLVSRVRWLLFGPIQQAWSNYSTLSVELVLNTWLFLLGHIFQWSAPSPRLVHCPSLRKVPPGRLWWASVIAERVSISRNLWPWRASISCNYSQYKTPTSCKPCHPS